MKFRLSYSLMRNAKNNSKLLKVQSPSISLQPILLPLTLIKGKSPTSSIATLTRKTFEVMAGDFLECQSRYVKCVAMLGTLQLYDTTNLKRALTLLIDRMCMSDKYLFRVVQCKNRLLNSNKLGSLPSIVSQSQETSCASICFKTILIIETEQ